MSIKTKTITAIAGATAIASIGTLLTLKKFKLNLQLILQ